MAHLFKPKKVYYVDAGGKRVPKDTPGARKVTEDLRKWYAKGTPLPKGKKIPLAADKRAAQQMLARLEAEIERGETPIGGPEVKASRRPIGEHLAAFEAHLKASGEVGAEHLGKKMSKLRRIVSECRMERLADITTTKVEQFLAELRENGRDIPPLDSGKATYTRSELAAALGVKPEALTSLVWRHRLEAADDGKARRYPRATAEALRERLVQPLGMQTSNHYVAAVQSFARWLVETRRLDKDPLAELKPGNVKKDLRHDRRTLPLPELARLFQAAGQSDRTFRGLAGPDRLALYLMACGSGFRAGELAVLGPESFDLDGNPPVAYLPAREDKAGRSVKQPLPPGLVLALREYLAGKPRGQPVWPGTWHERAAEMLRGDLETAGIPYVIQGTDGPLFADFHALRHSFVALLDRSGATLKEAMQLARHSDPRLTMARYGRAELEDLGQTVAGLPPLLPGPGPTAVQTSALAEMPRHALELLAVLGLAALAAGCFGESWDWTHKAE